MMLRAGVWPLILGCLRPLALLCLLRYCPVSALSTGINTWGNNCSTPYKTHPVSTPGLWLPACWQCILCAVALSLHLLLGLDLLRRYNKKQKQHNSTRQELLKLLCLDQRDWSSPRGSSTYCSRLASGGPRHRLGWEFLISWWVRGGSGRWPRILESCYRLGGFRPCNLVGSWLRILEFCYRLGGFRPFNLVGRCLRILEFHAWGFCGDSEELLRNLSQNNRCAVYRGSLDKGTEARNSTSLLEPPGHSSRIIEECLYVCAFSIRLRLSVTDFLSDAHTQVPIPQVLWADYLGEIVTD